MESDKEMDKINLTCQGCSNHCPLQVTVEEGKVEEVQGNCCHRGIVSANTQIAQRMRENNTDSFTGEKRIYCTGCGNRCDMKVTMENGCIVAVKGDGCRRGIISARKQLEGIR